MRAIQMTAEDNRKQHPDIFKVVTECRKYLSVDGILFPYKPVKKPNRISQMMPPFTGNPKEKK